MRGRTSRVVLAVVLLGGGACSADEPGDAAPNRQQVESPEPSKAAPTPTTSPSLEHPRDRAAYRRWLDREELPSCGEHVLTPADRAEELLPHRRCLADALDAGTGAEAVVRFSTVEGDPITSYLRVHPDGTTELFSDSSEDRFAGRIWVHRECGDLRDLLGWRC